MSSTLNAATSGGLTMTSDTSGILKLQTAGTDAVTITAAQNVGVGTTTPYAKLQATGTIKVATGNAQGILALGEANGTTVNYGIWRGAANAPTSDGNYLNFGGYDGLVFATGNAAIGSQTERMRIDSSGTLSIQNDYQEKNYTANSSTAITLSLANGTLQIITLTGNCTFTFPTAVAGKSFLLLLRQDATGSRTATWPATVKWPAGTAPTITATASKQDIISFVSDGTNWYGAAGGQNYTV